MFHGLFFVRSLACLALKDAIEAARQLIRSNLQLLFTDGARLIGYSAKVTV